MNEPTASTLAINKLMLYLSPAPLKGWWGVMGLYVMILRLTIHENISIAFGRGDSFHVSSMVLAILHNVIM
jgi:hypothetical protein